MLFRFIIVSQEMLKNMKVMPLEQKDG